MIWPRVTRLSSLVEQENPLLHEFVLGDLCRETSACPYSRAAFLLFRRCSKYA